MKLKKFLLLLDKYYWSEGGINKNFACKYYAQRDSFSYELHDAKKTCFTLSSRIFESDVFYDWVHKPKVRQEIIDDIHHQIKIIKKQK